MAARTGRHQRRPGARSRTGRSGGACGVAPAGEADATRNGPPSCSARRSTTPTSRSRPSFSSAKPTPGSLSAAPASTSRASAVGREPCEHRRLLEAFLVASQKGDLAALESLLASDVVSYSEAVASCTRLECRSSGANVSRRWHLPLASCLPSIPPAFRRWRPRASAQRSRRGWVGSVRVRGDRARTRRD